MQVKEEWKQPVAPKDFYGAVLMVIALLGGMGIYLMQTGHVPQFSPKWEAAYLLVVLAVAFRMMVKYGWRWLTLARVGIFLGYGLLVSSRFVSPALLLKAVFGDAGTLLMMIGFAATLFDFKKKLRLEAIDGDAGLSRG